MEFAYDKLQQGAATPKDENGNKKPETSIDKAADKLESGIEKAYASISGANWSGLWNTVKSKGEQAFNESKKELGEFLKDDSSSTNNKTPTNSEESTDATTSSANSSNAENLEGSTDTVKPKNSDRDARPGMFDELTKKAQLYIDELDRDLEKVENAAGSYFSKFGQDLRDVLKSAVSVDAPAISRSSSYDSESGQDLPNEVLFNVPEDIRDQIYSTRLDAQLHALHTSTEPFLTETVNEPGYSAFADDFNVEEASERIKQDLDQHPKLQSLMESLVPEKVSYVEFWTKYYFMRRKIADQEQKRKMLVEQASAIEGEDGDEVTWDDDDDDEDEENDGRSKTAHKKSESNDAKQSKTSSSSRPSSESSYDVVSNNASTTDLKKGEVSKDKKTRSDDDDDDDWE